MSSLAPYDAIMLLSYGGPNGPEDVLPFMRNATRGRGVPDERLLQVSEHYKLFGGVSPINECNRRLLGHLRRELDQRGCDIALGWGNRNWHPFVSEGLRELADAGARRILALPTSAYASYSGCRQYREDIAAALVELEDTYAPGVLTVDKVRPYYNTDGMFNAQVRSIQVAYAKLAEQGFKPQQIKLLYVTHSIPLAMEAGSAPSAEELERFPRLANEISYVAQHQALIEALQPALEWALGVKQVNADLAYCSRSGPPHAKWLESDINDVLAQLDRDQIQAVVVAPIGFITDHMEVVYDLDTEAAQTAAELGLGYERADTVSEDPEFVSSLVDIMEERAAHARGESYEIVNTTGTGPFHTVCPPQCCRSGATPARPGPDRFAPASVFNSFRS